jgi:DNA-binding transcriptional ArsR family regulator
MARNRSTPNGGAEAVLSTADSEAIARACGALAHPTRAVVLATLANGKASPVQIARSLERSIAAVSHHFHVLQDARLLRAAGTRPNRGTVEHFYELTAQGEALVKLLGPIAAAAEVKERRRR